jgi:hypothetical protein
MLLDLDRRPVNSNVRFLLFMSSQPRTQLAKAQASLESMRNSISLDAFEGHWKDLLHHVERVWTKSLHKYDSYQGWRALKAKYESLRNNDPLLSYVKNARDADEHTVNEVVDREPGGIGINAAEGNALYIERMEFGGGKISIKSPQRIRVDFIPGKIRLLPVIKRDRTYDVPTTHLGDALDPNKVVEVAQKVVTFYAGFLDEVEMSLGK